MSRRWRGRIPHRSRVLKDAVLIERQKRTGEPFLALSSSQEWDALYQYYKRERPSAKGTYTEKMRFALAGWCAKRHSNTVIFNYKLHRHTVITVIGRIRSIRHDPHWGNGKRGFVLDCRIDSVDGIKPVMRVATFALNRIQGEFTQELFLLTSGGRLNGL